MVPAGSRAGAPRMARRGTAWDSRILYGGGGGSRSDRFVWRLRIRRGADGRRACRAGASDRRHSIALPRLLALKEPSPRAHTVLRFRPAQELATRKKLNRSSSATFWHRSPAARVGRPAFSSKSGEREKGADHAGLNVAKTGPGSLSASLPRFWEGLDAQQLEALLAQTQAIGGCHRSSGGEAAVQEGARSTPVPPAGKPAPDLADL